MSKMINIAENFSPSLYSLNKVVEDIYHALSLFVSLSLDKVQISVKSVFVLLHRSVTVFVFFFFLSAYSQHIENISIQFLSVKDF